jgi:hypothetical protein
MQEAAAAMALLTANPVDDGAAQQPDKPVAPAVKAPAQRLQGSRACCRAGVVALRACNISPCRPPPCLSLDGPHRCHVCAQHPQVLVTQPQPRSACLVQHLTRLQRSACSASLARSLSTASPACPAPRASSAAYRGPPFARSALEL